MQRTSSSCLLCFPVNLHSLNQFVWITLLKKKWKPCEHILEVLALSWLANSNIIHPPSLFHTLALDKVVGS